MASQFDWNGRRPNDRIVPFSRPSSGPSYSQQLAAYRSSQLAAQQAQVAAENQRRAAATAERNARAKDSYNAAVITAAASASRAREDALSRIKQAQMDATTRAGLSAIDAAATKRPADFLQSKYNAIAPVLNDQLSKSNDNYGMYYALGGGRPVTRESLGLPSQVISDSDVANTNNSYASLMNSAAQNAAGKFGSRYSSDSPILQGLIGNMNSSALADSYSSGLKRGIDASTANKEYMLASQALLDKRNQTLSGLRSAAMDSKSNLLQALAGMG